MKTKKNITIETNAKQNILRVVWDLWTLLYVRLVLEARSRLSSESICCQLVINSVEVILLDIGYLTTSPAVLCLWKLRMELNQAVAVDSGTKPVLLASHL